MSKKKIGRPTIYSEKLAGEICRRLYESDGEKLPESLRTICKDPDMPNMSTVCDWLKDEDKKDFAKQYARARELRKEAFVDRILHLSEKAKNAATGAPGTGEAGAKVQAYRLEIDSLKWLLSKEYARDYGDKITQEISGLDGAAIAMTGDYRPSTADEEMIKRIAEKRESIQRESSEE